MLQGHCCHDISEYGPYVQIQRSLLGHQTFSLFNKRWFRRKKLSKSTCPTEFLLASGCQALACGIKPCMLLNSIDLKTYFWFCLFYFRKLNHFFAPLCLHHTTKQQLNPWLHRRAYGLSTCSNCIRPLGKEFFHHLGYKPFLPWCLNTSFP